MPRPTILLPTKLKDATSAYQDNTVSLILNQGGQEDLSKKVDTAKQAVIEQERALGSAGKAYLENKDRAVTAADGITIAFQKGGTKYCFSSSQCYG
jgi:hypothetical protein